jgi:hypothetical protein
MRRSAVIAMRPGSSEALLGKYSVIIGAPDLQSTSREGTRRFGELNAPCTGALARGCPVMGITISINNASRYIIRNCITNRAVSCEGALYCCTGTWRRNSYLSPAAPAVSRGGTHRMANRDRNSALWRICGRCAVKALRFDCDVCVICKRHSRLVVKRMTLRIVGKIIRRSIVISNGAPEILFGIRNCHVDVKG